MELGSSGSAALRSTRGPPGASSSPSLGSLPPARTNRTSRMAPACRMPTCGHHILTTLPGAHPAPACWDPLDGIPEPLWWGEEGSSPAQGTGGRGTGGMLEGGGVPGGVPSLGALVEAQRSPPEWGASARKEAWGSRSLPGGGSDPSIEQILSGYRMDPSLALGWGQMAPPGRLQGGGSSPDPTQPRSWGDPYDPAQWGALGESIPWVWTGNPCP